jgi:hypothetical protein
LNHCKGLLNLKPDSIMPDLSLQYIDRITNDVNKQEIIFSHLADELIDHICCDVENEMESGLSFYEAYKKVKRKMGSRRLKEIQEETLYAVDTKYRKMKNTMKISGIAGTVLLGFAALFKINHWPLAGAMLTLGAFTLAFVFMPTALGVLWKETRSRRRIFLFLSAFLAGFCFIAGTLFKVQHWLDSGLILTLAAFFGILFFVPALLADKLSDTEKKEKRPVYILGATGVVFYLAGMFFKVMHWPLAAVLMATGMVVLCLLAFPWFTWITWKEATYVHSHFIFMILTMFLIIVPGALVSLNLQHSYESGYFPNLERQQMIYNVKADQNKLILAEYKDSLFYSEMERIHSRTGELISYITDIEVKMVQESEGKPGSPALANDKISKTENGQVILYSELSDPFTPEPVQNYLLDGSETRQNLESEISDFSKFISELQANDNQNYSGALKASGELVGLLPENKNVSLMSGLHSLELMKNTLLFIEAGLFGLMAGK